MRVHNTERGYKSILGTRLIYVLLSFVNKQWNNPDSRLISRPEDFHNEIFPIDIRILPNQQALQRLPMQVAGWAVIDAIDKIYHLEPEGQYWNVPIWDIILRDIITLGVIELNPLGGENPAGNLSTSTRLTSREDAVNTRLGAFTVERQYTGQQMAWDWTLLAFFRLMQQVWRYQPSASVSRVYPPGTAVDVTLEIPESTTVYIMTLTLQDLGSSQEPITFHDIINILQGVILEPIQVNRWESCKVTFSRDDLPRFAEVQWSIRDPNEQKEKIPPESKLEGE